MQRRIAFSVIPLLILILILILTVSFVFVSGYASAQTLILDDFEAYELGKEPPKDAWRHIKGNAFDANPEALIVEDPTRPGNKVYSQSGLRVYASKEAFDNFTFEFDWMVDKDVNANVVWRVQTAVQYFYFTRRRGGELLQIFRLNNNSTLLNQGSDKWASKPNQWYTAQISAQGAKHTLKIKPFDPNRRFDKVDPIAVVENPDYPKGPVGFWGAVGGTLYVDNAQVYGPKGKTSDFLAVQPNAKLIAMWAKLKAIREK